MTRNVAHPSSAPDRDQDHKAVPIKKRNTQIRFAYRWRSVTSRHGNTFGHLQNFFPICTFEIGSVWEAGHVYSAFMNGTLNDKCNTTYNMWGQRKHCKRSAPKWLRNEDLGDERPIQYTNIHTQHPINSTYTFKKCIPKFFLHFVTPPPDILEGQGGKAAMTRYLRSLPFPTYSHPFLPPTSRRRKWNNLDRRQDGKRVRSTLERKGREEYHHPQETEFLVHFHYNVFAKMMPSALDLFSH